MKLLCVILISVLMISNILNAKIIKASDLKPHTYSIKIGAFKKDSNIKKIEKNFKKYDILSLKKNHLFHIYITNIKNKKSALHIINKLVKPQYHDAYIIKNKKRKYKTYVKKEIKKKNNKNKNIKKIVKIDPIKNRENIKTMTLTDALLISLKRSNKILSLKEKVIQQKHKVREIKGAFYPNINLYSTSAYNYNHQRSDDDLENHFANSNIQLNLTENIYAGGKHINQLKKEKYKFLSEIASFKGKVEEEIIKITKAYIDLYYQKKAIKIERDNMKSLKKILNIVKIKEENGATTKGDLNNIKSKVENASTALVKATSKYQTALAYYSYFVGKNNADLTPNQGEFIFPEHNRTTLLKIFQKNNSKILSSRYKIEAQKYDYQAKKAPFRPNIDFVINTKEKFSKADTDPFRDEKANVALSLNYNLYKGGIDKEKLLISKSKIDQLTYQYNDILKGTKYNLEKLYDTLNSSKESLKHIENEVNANKKTLNSYWTAFKYGNQDIQALLLAQRALNRSKIDRLKEKKRYILNYFNLLSQSGELLKYLRIDKVSSIFNF